jgi:hypothetical protein
MLTYACRVIQTPWQLDNPYYRNNLKGINTTNNMTHENMAPIIIIFKN